MLGVGYNVYADGSSGAVLSSSDNVSTDNSYNVSSSSETVSSSVEMVEGGENSSSLVHIEPTKQAEEETTEPSVESTVHESGGGTFGGGSSISSGSLNDLMDDVFGPSTPQVPFSPMPESFVETRTSYPIPGYQAGFVAPLEWGSGIVFSIGGFFNSYNFNGMPAANFMDKVFEMLRRSFASVHGEIKSVYDVAAGGIKNLNSFAYWVDQANAEHRANFEKVNGRIDSAVGFTKTIQSYSDKYYTENKNAIASLTGFVKTIQSYGDKHYEENKDSIASLTGYVNTVKGYADQHYTENKDGLASLTGYVNTIKGFVDKYYNENKAALADEVKARETLSTWVDKANAEHRKDISDLKAGQLVQDGLITAGALKNADQDLAIKATEDSIFSLNGKFLALEPEVRTLKTDVADLKTAIAGAMTQSQHHQNLSNFFLEKGYFGQHITNLFEKYFGGSAETEFTEPTGIFTKWLYMGIKILVQNILDVKEDVTDNFDTLFIKLAWLETISKNLETSNTWLQSILEKIGTGGGGSVVIPPFDFAKLKEILGELSFGNVVNEAGTNIWDFLQELIKGLSGIISGGLSDITALLKDLLKFLDSLLDKLIYLIVPKNWDFLENGFGGLNQQITVKFGAFLDLGGKIKTAFTPKQGDFFSALNFDMLGVHFDFTGGKKYLDNFVPKFRMLMSIGLWFSTAIWVYKKITGGGDVIAD